MSKADIFAGNCGFNTQVEAKMEGSTCSLNITSECAAIEHMSEELKDVNPYQEISFKRSMPLIHKMELLKLKPVWHCLRM